MPKTKDIVIDNNVMCLYDKPKSANIKQMFHWLKEEGALTVSQKLIIEYVGSGNRLITALIDNLIRDGRYNRIPKKNLDAFNEDRHFKYTCNRKDRYHAKLVFLSHRKLLVSFDNKFLSDVNLFKKVNKIQPRATKSPDPAFYS